MKKHFLLACLLIFTGLLIITPLSKAQSSTNASLAEIINFKDDANNIVLAGQDVLLESEEEAENIVVLGGNAYIHGRVWGEVVVLGGDIYLTDTGVIEGSAVTIGGNIELKPGGQIYGEQVSVNLANLKTILPSCLLLKPRKITFGWWKSLFHIFLGLILYWLFPKSIIKIKETISHNPAKSTMYGLLTCLAILPLSLFLLITILGIPLVPLVWLLLVAANILGRTALGLLLGEALAKNFNWSFKEALLLTLGVFLLNLLTIIPLVGGLASLFYLLIGVGGATWSKLGTVSPAEKGE